MEWLLHVVATRTPSGRWGDHQSGRNALSSMTFCQITSRQDCESESMYAGFQGNQCPPNFPRKYVQGKDEVDYIFAYCVDSPVSFLELI